MEKIVDIIDNIAYEKGLSSKDVEEIVKESMIQTMKKVVDEDLNFDVEIDRKNKELRLFQKVEVVEDNDKRIDNEKYVGISKVKEDGYNVEIGDFIAYDLEFENLGRNAAMILYNNIEFKVQRLIEKQIFNKYKQKVGKVITASVIRIDSNENTFIEIGEVKGIMPKKNRIKGESFKVGDVIKAVIKNVYIDKFHGLIVEISRTDPKFLKALITLEVPEVKDKIITIHEVARIPGVRAKIAVSSVDKEIDPIGSIVGQKGLRIKAVSNELCGESIDCVEYSSVDEIFVAKALTPAIVKNVKITKKKNKQKGIAEVEIFEDQKSKAIGKQGLNIRLASMLTKYDIVIKEIKSTEQTPKKGIEQLAALFK